MHISISLITTTITTTKDIKSIAYNDIWKLLLEVIHNGSKLKHQNRKFKKVRNMNY